MLATDARQQVSSQGGQGAFREGYSPITRAQKLSNVACLASEPTLAFAFNGELQ